MFRKVKLITLELANRIKKDDISAWASQLTFYIILSIFPFLIFLVAMINRIQFINIDALYTTLDFFPRQITNLILVLFKDINESSTSTTLLSITFIATIWAASKGFMAIIKALNIAYDEQETRSYFFLRGISIIYTFVLAALIGFVLLLIVFGGTIINLLFEYIPILESLGSLITLLRYLVSMFFTFWFFILIYNATPNKKISVKDATPGAIFSTLLWIVVSTGFSIYVTNSTSLSYLYGSLTSIIVLLLWLYLTSTIIMIGGELNAIIYHIKALESPKI
ncbi:MAG: YihY/virulence factor BrkB family protein [Vallitaleaceae bacterium]|jgi:membrane protein|nr:YihY/virulence factor BrkB family protein [Vallitaleaceae bacterium]